MIRAIRLGFFFLCLAVSAHARIGETLTQCVKRYGEPVKVTEHDRDWLVFESKVPPQESVRFKKQGILIVVTFFEGKADCIAFAKPFRIEKTDGFSSDEIATLLKVNGGGLDWLAARGNDAAYEQKVWKTIGGTLFATYDFPILVVATDGYARRLDAREQAEAASRKSSATQNLKGF